MTLVAAAFALFLAVQTPQGSVVGSVRDAATGAPLAVATVALPDLDRTVLSDAAGHYVFEQVPAGPQHLTVRQLGYASRTLHALVARTGSLQIDIFLHAAPIPIRRIEVQPSIQIRGVADSDGGMRTDRTVSIAAMRNDPMMTEPDALQALNGGEVALRPESPSGLSILGGASDQTAYLLDGIPIFSPYHTAGTFSASDPDALSVVRVYSHATASAPDALSGVVEMTTRRPSAATHAAGSVSTTQVRMTVDGLLGSKGIGYLLSMRSGIPAFARPRRDGSYVRREDGDLLARLDAPLFGGALELIGFHNENEIDAASSASAPDTDTRNAFRWQSRSLGAMWSRQLSDLRLLVRAWNARGSAGAAWNAGAPGTMTWERGEDGISVMLRTEAASAPTSLGVRVQRVHSDYSFKRARAPAFGLTAPQAMSAGVFLEHTRRMTPHLQFDAGVAVDSRRSLNASPRAQLEWQPARPLQVLASYARSHQFAQSVRNAESVVGNIFPADLLLDLSPAVPVAKSDRAMLALQWRPDAALNLRLQMYATRSAGVLLIAPVEGEPFATRLPAVGSTLTRGILAEAGFSSARYAFTGTYALQRVRDRMGSLSYTPERAPLHVLTAGAIVFPSLTSSIRVGGTAAFGRRTSALAEPFEWESCNLRDGGCEFAGSPRYASGSVGLSRLPAYMRVDVGARKHWHISIAGRARRISAFGTLTNVLGRTNVLTFAPDVVSGESAPIEMRPAAPLVAGIDWQL